MAIYSTGISIGILLGFLGGGWIDEFFGWRTAFLVLGIPGILFALILRFTVKEPPRGLSENMKDAEEKRPSLKAVLQMLWKSRPFRYLALAGGLSTYILYSLNSWLPPFLARLHGMGSGEIGTWLSLLIGIGGGLGYFLGGFLADRMGKNDKRWYLWLPGIGIFLAIPFTMVTLFSSNTVLALVALAFPTFLLSLYLAPCLAITHGIVGIRMRAQASAVFFFVINIVGLGCGPFFTGMLSDLWQPSMGAESIRWALSTTLLVNIIGVYFYWKAAKALGK